MKKLRNGGLIAILAALVTATGCSSDTDGGGGDDPTPTPTPSNAVDVTANITADTTWSAANTYTLKNHVFVEAGTLTIEAGTRIQGDPGSSLVITRNAMIDAVGTTAAPIVFTSSVAPGGRLPGDWGGVVLLGRASINITGGENSVEGFSDTLGDLIAYGDAATPNDAHDCGTIRYARIEYAGFELSTDNELNGLTVAGCGTGTDLDYIQVHKGADDGVEMFGGTANLKHILITQPDDDGLDWDFGWRGKAQFVIVQQNGLVGNMGIEADNNNNDNDALPRSNPLIYNMSLIGSNAEPGTAGKTQGPIHFRRGTAGRIYNLIATKFTDMNIDVDGAPSATLANGTDLVISNSIFFDNANLDAVWPAETDNDGAFDEAGYFGNAAYSNRFQDSGLTSAALALNAPDFRPAAATAALTGHATPPTDGFFEPVTFVGGMGDTTDWTAGWALYPVN